MIHLSPTQFCSWSRPAYINTSLKFLAILTFVWVFSPTARGAEYTHDAIAKRYETVALSKSEVESAKMQGECLVGLKELNFKRTEKFDAVAEWTNYRTISLLEQFAPCQVLIMMEVAQRKLRN
tara:strand:+ start:1862 stop:2230 length:369 start_codon:yes stop_codon:yes gene_type:complete